MSGLHTLALSGESCSGTSHQRHFVVCIHNKLEALQDEILLNCPEASVKSIQERAMLRKYHANFSGTTGNCGFCMLSQKRCLVLTEAPCYFCHSHRYPPPSPSIVLGQQSWRWLAASCGHLCPSHVHPKHSWDPLDQWTHHPRQFAESLEVPGVRKLRIMLDANTNRLYINLYNIFISNIHLQLKIDKSFKNVNPTDPRISVKFSSPCFVSIIGSTIGRVEGFRIFSVYPDTSGEDVGAPEWCSVLAHCRIKLVLYASLNSIV